MGGKRWGEMGGGRGEGEGRRGGRGDERGERGGEGRKGEERGGEGRRGEERGLQSYEYMISQEVKSVAWGEGREAVRPKWSGRSRSRGRRVEAAAAAGGACGCDGGCAPSGRSRRLACRAAYESERLARTAPRCHLIAHRPLGRAAPPLHCPSHAAPTPSPCPSYPASPAPCVPSFLGTASTRSGSCPLAPPSATGRCVCVWGGEGAWVGVGLRGCAGAGVVVAFPRTPEARGRRTRQG